MVGEPARPVALAGWASGRGRCSWRSSRAVAAVRGRLRAGQAARRVARRALPAADLGEIKALHAAVRQGVRSGALRSAHDVAEGGVAVALAEVLIAGGVGAR